MFVRTLLVAIVAGLVAGILMTGAQHVKVVPLILHAEQYEDRGTAEGHSHLNIEAAQRAVAALFAPVVPARAHGEAADESGGILFGLDRFGGTLVANLVAGAGFALLLAAVSLLTGQPITLANGLSWGAAGWLCVQLLPALGLPPELPGFPYADLEARQIWWSVTVIFSAAGLYLLVLRPESWAKVLGVVALAAPHLYGAPQPHDIESAVPAFLAAEYSVAALATTLFFWLVLGTMLGFLSERFGGRA